MAGGFGGVTPEVTDSNPLGIVPTLNSTIQHHSDDATIEPVEVINAFHSFIHLYLERQY
jgi:hypothetical protein